jgi:hypothetical protein
MTGGHGGGHAGYGSHLEAGTYVPKQINPKRRRPMACSSLCTLLLVPSALFVICYWAVTFKVHYNIPMLCWSIVLACFLVALAIAGTAYQKVQTQGISWLVFLSICCFAGVILGAVLGDMNYWTNMQPYYDLDTLNYYVNTDASQSKGEAMMDAGFVRFMEGSGLELGKSASFQNLDTYCVAPIVNGSALLDTSDNMKTYDFWAIGLNCCPRNTSKAVTFQCGAYNKKGAREGLRLMDDSQRDYFRMAVQQAEAQYRIHAAHPIFFYWAEDSRSQWQGYWDYGNKYYNVGVVAYIFFQIFLVMVATVLTAKHEFTSASSL